MHQLPTASGEGGVVPRLCVDLTWGLVLLPALVHRAQIDLDSTSLSEFSAPESDTESDTERMEGDPGESGSGQEGSGVDGSRSASGNPSSFVVERSLESRELWRGARPLEWAVGDPRAATPQTRLRAQACLTGSVVDADTSAIVHATPTAKQQQRKKRHKRRQQQQRGGSHHDLQAKGSVVGDDGIPATGTVPARVLRVQLNGSLDLELETGQVARSVPSDRVRVRSLRPPRGGLDSRPHTGLDAARDATLALRRARARMREAWAAFRAVRDGRAPLRPRVLKVPRTQSPTASGPRTLSRRRVRMGHAPSSPLLAPGAESFGRADATGVRTVAIGGGRVGDSVSKSAGPCDLAQFVLEAVADEMRSRPPLTEEIEPHFPAADPRGSWTDHGDTDSGSHRLSGGGDESVQWRRTAPHAVFVADERGDVDSMGDSMEAGDRSGPRVGSGSGAGSGLGLRAGGAGLTSPQRARASSWQTDTSPTHDATTSVEMDASSGWDDPLEVSSDGSPAPTENSAPQRARRVRARLLSRLRTRLNSVIAILDEPASSRNGNDQPRRRQWRRRRRRAEREAGQLEAAIRRLEGSGNEEEEGEDAAALTAIVAGLFPGDEGDAGDLGGELDEGGDWQRVWGKSDTDTAGGGDRGIPSGDEAGDGPPSGAARATESLAGSSGGKLGSNARDTSDDPGKDGPGAAGPLDHLHVETGPSLEWGNARIHSSSPWPSQHPSFPHSSSMDPNRIRGHSRAGPHSGSALDSRPPASRREAARLALEAWSEADAACEQRRMQRIEAWVRRGGEAASLDAALEAWWAFARRGPRRGLDQATFFAVEAQLYEALIGERSRDATVRARASARADWRRNCADGLRMDRAEYQRAMLVLAVRAVGNDVRMKRRGDGGWGGGRWDR